MIRSRFIFGALASVLVLSACKKDKVGPNSETSKALLAHEWRLTETHLNGQLTGSGNLVKDQYDWHFMNGGGYHLTYVADGATVQGQWELTSAGLHIIDHKGDPHDRTIQQINNTTLQLRWEERPGEVHEDTYTAQ